MKRLYFIVLLFGLSIASFANDRCLQKKQCMSRKEFMELKRDFLIRKAELTPEEADAFFPLYTELNLAKKELNKQALELSKQTDAEEGLSDEAYEKAILKIYELRIRADELDRTYYQKIRKVLSPKKIFQIQQAELRFHKKMVRGFSNGHGNGNGNRKGCR